MTTRSIDRTVDPVRDSFEHLLVITFAKSTSSTYSLALSVAKGATKYSELTLDKQTIHLAAFGRSPDEASRALSILRYLAGVKSLQVFVQGRPVTKPWELTNVLECYTNAVTCADPRAHCHVVLEDPFEIRSPRYGLSMRISLASPDSGKAEEDQEKGPARYLFPCRLLQPRFRFQIGHPSQPADLIQAAAVNEGCHWCPLFDPKAFRRLPKQIRIGEDVFEVSSE